MNVYMYFQVKDAGRYKEVERTQGVSTTDLVNRMLERTKSDADDEGFSLDDDGHHEETNCTLHPASSHSHSPWTGVSQFLQTTRKIHSFSDAKEVPVSILLSVPHYLFIVHEMLTNFFLNNDLLQPGAKVIYTAGAFDVFHPGHLAFLEAARSQGTTFKQQAFCKMIQRTLYVNLK